MYDKYSKLQAVIVGRSEDFVLPKIDWILETYQGIRLGAKEGMLQSQSIGLGEVDPSNH
ncbi:hypothetical protein ACWX0P_30420 [Vibrio mediterranei]